jgi:circadian clock protein KaiB
MLYVAGVDRKSTEAIKAITGLCDEHLEGRYQLVIVDIYQEPALAREERIIAAPTLIIKRPLPSRRLVGSMEDLEKVLVGLGGRPLS